ncbi:hypothetical protein [Actinomadura rugatobispora]|uniref:Uncharacterized protein n=1 Tax=Actinomadura rugatobispora TaxID=1994 RepID=A0ABW1ADW4_9ACTN
MHHIADAARVREFASSPNRDQSMAGDRLLFIGDWVGDHGLTLDV